MICLSKLVQNIRFNTSTFLEIFRRKNGNILITCRESVIWRNLTCSFSWVVIFLLLSAQVQNLYNLLITYTSNHTQSILMLCCTVFEKISCKVRDVFSESPDIMTNLKKRFPNKTFNLKVNVINRW